MANPKVEIILAETHRIKAGDRLFITIDPGFADYAGSIGLSLRNQGIDVLGVLPVPKGSIQFFAIESGVEVNLDPALQELQNGKS